MKKRKGFFDDLSEISETSENENIRYDGSLPEPSNGIAVGKDGANVASEGKYRKRGIIILCVAAVLVVALIFTYLAYSNGWIGGKYSKDGEEDGKNGAYKDEFYFYEPDYETDIFTLPDYLELDRSVKYAPDSSETHKIANGNYALEYNDGLNVLGEYLNAVIAGDHEAVNALLTDKCLENVKYERFPPQKLFSIKIRNIKEEKGNAYDKYYFAVSYLIYRNDGLFRDNVDGEKGVVQGFEIFVYANGAGRINAITELNGYSIGID